MRHYHYLGNPRGEFPYIYMCVCIAHYDICAPTACYHTSQMSIARIPSVPYRTPIHDMRLQSLLHNIYPPGIGGGKRLPRRLELVNQSLDNNSPPTTSIDFLRFPQHYKIPARPISKQLRPIPLTLSIAMSPVSTTVNICN